MKFSVVVGGIFKKIFPWNRLSHSRLGQKKGGKFELFWVLLREIATLGVFVALCVMKGVYGGSYSHSWAEVGPLHHEGDLHPFLRGKVDLLHHEGGRNPPFLHFKATAGSLQHDIKLGLEFNFPNRLSFSIYEDQGRKRDGV